MRVIAISTLSRFWAKHPKAKSALVNWHEEVKNSNWLTPADVKAKFVTASILQNKRVVFNIAGNSYRLVVAIDYKRQIVFIKFLGTHAEYDQINAQTSEFKRIEES